MKKLNILVSTLLVFGLLITPMCFQDVNAAVPGNNTLVNYNHDNTALAGGTDDFGRISEDGRTVIWSTFNNTVLLNQPHARKLFKRNLDTGVTSVVTANKFGVPVGIQNGDSGWDMSRTGKYVIFTSNVGDMVSTHTYGGGEFHLYLRDTHTGVNTLVDQSASGVMGNASINQVGSVSDDGRFVVFSSAAKNLLPSGNPTAGSHVYIKDMVTGKVTLVTSNTGAIGNYTSLVGKLKASCDGSIIVFRADATNLTPQDDGQVNTYLVDVRNGYDIQNLTYAANQDVSPISISCNGRYVVLHSTATNLTSDTVSGTVYNGFRYDRVNKEFILTNKTNSGAVSTLSGGAGDISDDGKVVFASANTNMVSPAATYSPQLYVRDSDAGTTELISVDSIGAEISPTSLGSVSINARGDTVLWRTQAGGLMTGVGSSSGYKLLISQIK